VVSNFDSRLEGVLTGLGLADWFETVVVSSRAGAAKPSPVPFQQALAALGLSPAQAWHVGDSPEDEAGARAAGLRCLIVRRP
jgi:putative hydrolase of the HAD superfamily